MRPQVLGITDGVSAVYQPNAMAEYPLSVSLACKVEGKARYTVEISLDGQDWFAARDLHDGQVLRDLTNDGLWWLSQPFKFLRVTGCGLVSVTAHQYDGH